MEKKIKRHPKKVSDLITTIWYTFPVASPLAHLSFSPMISSLVIASRQGDQ